MAVSGNFYHVVHSNISKRLDEIAQEGENRKISGWTPTQIQNFALKTIAGANLTTAFCVGVGAFFGGVSTALSMAVPIFLGIGVTSFAFSSKLRDYANIEKLKGYRQKPLEELKELQLEEMNQMNIQDRGKNILRRVVTRHGWENMFLYAIPLPKDLIKLYQFQCKYMNPLEIIDFYEEANNALESARRKYGDKVKFFRIPSPRIVQQKWKEISLDQIFMYPRMDRFIDNGILHLSNKEKFIDLRKQYQLLQNKYQKAYFQYKRNYEKERKPFHDRLQKELRYADEIYEAHPAHSKIRKLCRDQINEEDSLKQKEEIKLSTSHRELDQLESRMKALKGNGDALLADAIHLAKKAFKIEKNSIRRQFRSQYKDILKRYDERREPYLRQLKVAQKKREIKKKFLKKQYDSQIWVERERFVQLSKSEKNNYLIELKSIEKQLFKIFK